MISSIYNGPVFDIARIQFERIADHLSIPEGERERLLYPKRSVAVSCPIHMDERAVARHRTGISCAEAP
jgi:glutamate dehydrogenase (NAD(P)+)